VPAPPAIQFDPGFAAQVTDLQGKLERFAVESEPNGLYLVKVADEVFAAEAEDSFARAAEIPFAASTLERKDRRRRDRRLTGGRSTGSLRVLGGGVPSGLNLYSALTFPWQQALSTPVGLRSLQTMGFEFGTKGYLGRFASLHRTGTRHMPGRLDWFRDAESLDAAEEKLKDVNAHWWELAARRAGFTEREIIEWFDSDPDLAGRY
jgi:hypothetical protein